MEVNLLLGPRARSGWLTRLEGLKGHALHGALLPQKVKDGGLVVSGYWRDEGRTCASLDGDEAGILAPLHRQAMARVAAVAPFSGHGRCMWPVDGIRSKSCSVKLVAL